WWSRCLASSVGLPPPRELHQFTTSVFFFFTHPSSAAVCALSLHDALPIFVTVVELVAVEVGSPVAVSEVVAEKVSVSEPSNSELCAEHTNAIQSPTAVGVPLKLREEQLLVPSVNVPWATDRCTVTVSLSSA